LTVHVLSRLEGGERYAWWVINSSLGAAVRPGTVNNTNTGMSLSPRT
jgi:hypothetical protein